jgi:hypothetical protein
MARLVGTTVSRTYPGVATVAASSSSRAFSDASSGGRSRSAGAISKSSGARDREPLRSGPADDFDPESLRREWDE